MYTRKIAALRATTSAPPPRRPRRSRRAPTRQNKKDSPSCHDGHKLAISEADPSCVSPNFFTSCDPQFDAPGPTFDSLVGGDLPGVDPSTAALFWHSEVSRAEGLATAANQHLRFARCMCAKAWSRCIAPLPKGSHSKRVRLIGPSPTDKDHGQAGPDKADSLDNGKGHAEPGEEPGEEASKGCAEPMDQDEGKDGPPSPNAQDVEDADLEEWSGIGGQAAPSVL